MKIFEHDFEVLDDYDIQDLLRLEREGAIYVDHWIDELDDFRYIRIKLTKKEIKEYVRSMYALELFYRAGRPKSATSVLGIPRDIALRADSYAVEGVARHCPAAFLGEHLEELICCNVPERQEIIEEVGTKSLLSSVRGAFDALTPAIRLFMNREKGLACWEVSREDDIRDLLYVVLRSRVSDITREEPVPSIAGTYRFVDLFSELGRLFIEVKWIGKKNSWKRIIKEINDDIQSYVEHPSCENLFFIVIDAVKDIQDPHKFEKDLSRSQRIGKKEIRIEVFVREP